MTFIYIFLSSLLYLLIFVPLPYIAYKKKHYKTFLTLSISSAIGYLVMAIDPLFPFNPGMNGATCIRVMLIFVLPVYLMGVLSWIVLVIRAKKKNS